MNLKLEQLNMVKFNRIIDKINKAVDDNRKMGTKKKRKRRIQPTVVTKSKINTTRTSKIRSDLANRCAISLRLLKTIQFTFKHYAENHAHFDESMSPGEYPIVISKLLKDNLITQNSLDLADELKLLTKNKIEDDEHPAEWGNYTQYYYTFTDDGLSLFTGKMTRISNEEQKLVEKYITARTKGKYAHVFESMRHFQIDTSDQYEYTSALVASESDSIIQSLKNNLQFGMKDYPKGFKDLISDIDDISKDQFYRAKKYSYSKGLLYPLFSSTDEDTWAGRLYTPFTALKSEGRQFISCDEYPDDRLVDLDFATFQVHCLIHAIEELLPNKDVGNLKQDLMTKDFYNEIGQQYYKNPKNPIPNRQRKLMKQRSLSALFGEQNDQEHSKAYSAMKKAYPEFIDRLNELKAQPFEEFSKRFNQNESSILYKQASFYGTFYEVQLMSRIWEKLSAKGIYYLTIHDGILVPESQRDKAIKIMKKEAKSFFGYSPDISAEPIEKEEYLTVSTVPLKWV